ncbi:DUF2478 domain-containing protein [Prosthecomicrobium sp. N25]|uniref:DUF2478 domain-containing protein n=1 Tax=Prosthecomicrobium sp. N25 TaxID=3129254 RepID=UPI003076AE4F
MTHDPPKLAALAYAGRGTGDATLAGLAQRLARDGVRLAGMVQTSACRAVAGRAEMTLEDLARGTRLAISQDLGRHGRGCRLDAGALETAAAQALGGLRDGADLVILSKFGRREAEGGGFRQVIEAAVAADIPVLIGVSSEHRAAWLAFAEHLAVTLHGATEAEAWVRRAVRPRVREDA